MKEDEMYSTTKPFVFVLMPFNPDFDDIYQLGIKAVCSEVGAYCERVDEQIFLESMMERIYNQISKADIVISDMTGRNPNVFYETGYAHAIKKQVILLTKEVEDIPFDLKHYQHIVYAGKIGYLQQELKKKINWCIENLEQQSRISLPDAPLPLNIENERIDFNPGFTINGVSWKEGLVAKFPKMEPSNDIIYEYSLTVGLHNTSDKVLSSSIYHLSLVLPKECSTSKKNPFIDVVIPNGENTIIRFISFGRLFPDEWYSFTFNLYSDPWEFLMMEENVFTLKLLSEHGAKDYKFKVVE